MLSVEQYEALTARDADRRVVGATAEMPANLAQEIGHAIDGYLLDITPEP